MLGANFLYANYFLMTTPLKYCKKRNKIIFENLEELIKLFELSYNLSPHLSESNIKTLKFLISRIVNF
jgi:hypothetical protein